MYHQMKCFTGCHANLLLGHTKLFCYLLQISLGGFIVYPNSIQLTQNAFFHLGSSLIREGYCQDITISPGIQY